MRDRVATGFKLALVALLAFGVWKGYREFLYVSPAEKTYRKFADAVVFERWGDAQALAIDDAVPYLEDWSQPKRMGFGPPIAKATFVNDTAGRPNGTSYTRESEKTSPDGKTVDLVVVQQVARGNTIMPGAGAKRRHRVVLKLVGSDWKVSSVIEE